VTNFYSVTALKNISTAILLAIFLFGSTLKLSAQKNKLHIVLTGFRNDKGKLLLSIFNADKGFPASDKNAYGKHQQVIKNGKVIFDLELPDGEYAIAVLHDENGNMKMDTKAFGLPKEGYGFSQNVMGTFGPPSFKKAAVHFPQQKEIEIRMKY
jgi:uncharacterized protein (DUF2141 family)